MKIVACVKIVDGELNPFDASALECALQLSSDVTVLSMGPKSTLDALTPLTRLGARVILLSDSAFAGSDTLATAYILSTALRRLSPDLILCGRQSIDGDTAQVGPMVSAMLAIPLMTNALSVELMDCSVRAKTRFGNETVPFPAVVTLEKSYTLRFPSIFSKTQAVDILTNEDLMCDTEKCGLAGSPTRVVKTYENKSGTRKCKFIQKEELLPLLSELRQKTPQMQTMASSSEKLPFGWAIGEEVYDKAKEVCEEVLLLQKDDISGLYEKAKAEKPPVILWNADLWGRKNAPILAAQLGTGLCADCTALSVEDGTFYMYRPARGGNVYAKIKCLTQPQMATVRTKTESADVIFAMGRGMEDNIEDGFAFSKQIGAEVAASRGLVDTGKVPYAMQVGLTGKVVSPKVYIAAGIFGAVHHTCAIETAGTVIAINPDKDERIFSYADYGILAEFNKEDYTE